MTSKLIAFSAIVLVTVACNAVSAEIEQKEAVAGGYSGWWMSNECAEAFVVAKPYPRVGAFRLKDKESPLLITDIHSYWGIRTWFQEPIEDKRSFAPAASPAEAEMGKDGIILRGAPTLGLELIMDIRLDPEKPLLTIRHGFKNLATEKRRISIWIINAFPRQGIGVAPWSECSTFRRYQIWPFTDPDETCISFSKKMIKVNFAGQISSPKGFLKIGTVAESGIVAYWNWTTGTFLKSCVGYESAASYPEPGSNTILFSISNNSECPSFSELEHVGPLKEVAPGDTTWLEQKLEISYLPAADEKAITSMLFPGAEENHEEQRLHQGKSP
jgi:hypothetical protein